MRYVLSRYNHDISWLPEYTNDVVLYDRSDGWTKLEPEVNYQIITVPNIGSDIYDKFTFIIDNYDDLPDVAVYTKANIFKYITKPEFDQIKDNTSFTPILTQGHKTYTDRNGVVCFYADGLYFERNDYWYLHEHPPKHAKKIIDSFRMFRREYNAFAPGSNYILTREDIQRRPKELYERLRSYLEWTIYPGDAQLIERNLYYLWGTNQPIYDS